MLNGGYLNTMTRAIIYLLMDEMQGNKDVRVPVTRFGHQEVNGEKRPDPHI